MIKLPADHSFFLLGPRQSGKSTLIQATFSPKTTLYYDLLKSEEFLRLTADPAAFRREVLARGKPISHIIIDEIQRIPLLLNEVHSILESGNPPFFGLSGSSARKLKHGQANLLAGRAWNYHLHPLTHREIGESFSLDRALQIGTLPSVYLAEKIEDAGKTLKAYVEMYLREEIQQEAVVRNLEGFMRFFQFAGGENGKIINYSNISREAGITSVTVKEYFQILEDTLVGMLLPPYSKSSRKRLVKHPKFYFFDTGVHRALTRKLSVPLERKTFDYGNAFEHFMIIEMMRLNSYLERDYTFSFYHTAGQAEVDLIIETPNGQVYAVEMKASVNPSLSQLKGLRSFSEICPRAELFCASLAPHRSKLGNITILPWKELFEEIRL